MATKLPSSLRSAGVEMADVQLLSEAFDPASELARFNAHHPGAGGIVSFLGQVREGGGVEALELRHYGPLTLPGMRELAGQAQARWIVEGLLVIHRAGLMHPREPIVLVA